MRFSGPLVSRNQAMSLATESWTSTVAAQAPSTNIEFSFSDTVAGYIRNVDRPAGTFTVETSDGREFEASLTPTTFGRITQSLDEPYIDATSRFNELIAPGQFVYAYGIFYFDGGPQHKFEAKALVFPGE